jgi:predicted glycosyltransferase
LTDPASRAPRLLFVPVSGAYGMGEYARALAIAQGAVARWPGAQIHFLVSSRAPYAGSTPFAHTLLPASPTFHSTEVNACIGRFRPDVVIFDNAGRTAQLRAAQRAGAAVIYVSSRRRQRGKAFRWRWMGLLDEHWIAYPEFIAGSPGMIEKLKLKLRGRPRLRYLDVILAPAAAAGEGSAAAPAEPFALVVPGGGTGHPGAADAAGRFLAAAEGLATQGVRTVFVGPAAGGAARAGLTIHPLVSQGELARLLRNAALVVVNGGSTLLQALACGRACVAVAIARDQRERIRRCRNAGVAQAAVLEGDAIVARALALWRDEPSRAALGQRAADLKLADGIGVALAGIAASLRR